MHMPRHERRNIKLEKTLQYLRALGVGLLIMTALILCDIAGRLWL
jgi:hypothetical protein